MICRTCNHNSNRIQVIDGKDYCNNCTGMTETGGAKVDGSITRNSFRVREQQKQYQGDMIPPYTYDKSKRRGVPNKDFIQQYPEQAKKTYTTDELQSVGVTKMKGQA